MNPHNIEKQIDNLLKQKAEFGKMEISIGDDIKAFKRKTKDEVDGINLSRFKDVSIGEQYETLNKVIRLKEHSDLWWIHFWLQTIFILIEVMPVLMKIFSDISSYDLFVEENFHNNLNKIYKKGS